MAELKNEAEAIWNALEVEVGVGIGVGLRYKTKSKGHELSIGGEVAFSVRASDDENRTGLVDNANLGAKASIGRIEFEGTFVDAEGVFHPSRVTYKEKVEVFKGKVTFNGTAVDDDVSESSLTIFPFKVQYRWDHSKYSETLN